MNRLFNGFFDGPRAVAATIGGRFLPAVDLVETDAHYVLRADLPGLSEDDVKIELEENVLTISGERRNEQETREDGYYRIERGYGHFSRSLTLPQGVDDDSIVATFDRGVLEVKIPKPEQRKPRRVTIGVGTGGALEGSESPA
jgi:HSP20 family protein